MKCTGKPKKSRRHEKVNMEESDREDNEDLNKEIEGENNKDEIREATESESEKIIDEKTKRTKNTKRRKKLQLQKGKGRGRLKKKRIWNQMSRLEEAIARMKCCLNQKKKQGRKTKASDSKERKLRNNASEDEDDTESESEEELKITRKMKKDGAEKNTKPRKKVMYPTCNTRSSPKALFDAIFLKFS
nr:hypothetical protein [Tanacetum cinerariifolium]